MRRSRWKASLIEMSRHDDNETQTVRGRIGSVKAVTGQGKNGW